MYISGENAVSVSQRLVAELQALDAGLPKAQAEADRIDAECVEIARELAALKLAASPKAAGLEHRLRERQLARANVMAAVSAKRGDITRQLENINGPDVTRFVDQCNREIRELNDRMRVVPRGVQRYEGHRREGKDMPLPADYKFSRRVVQSNADLIRSAAERIDRDRSRARALMFSDAATLREFITGHTEWYCHLDVSELGERYEEHAAFAPEVNKT